MLKNRSRVIITTLSVTALAALSAGHEANAEEPGVTIWTDASDLFRGGERVRVLFRTSLEDAYVTVIRVDTDGRVTVLFPENPWDDNLARTDREYHAAPTGRAHSFIVSEPPGRGYVFAIASTLPFNYAGFVTGSWWDYRFIAHDGRIVGDPYTALSGIVSTIANDSSATLTYDVHPYFVEERFEYPRFLCYDCHAFDGSPAWNPYDQPCKRFSIVVYDDPTYYPVRATRGQNVVFSLPTSSSLEPRFVFVDRDDHRPYVDYMTARPNDPERRMAAGARGRDFGGVGRVPTPVGGRPAANATQGVGATGARPTLQRRISPAAAAPTGNRPDSVLPSKTPLDSTTRKPDTSGVGRRR